MKYSKVICIAGKNSIDVEDLNYCLGNHSDKKFYFCRVASPNE